MRPVINIAGQRFGRLVVVSMAALNKKGALWLCRCDCGGKKTVPGQHLRGGYVWSCGCARGTHHQSKTRLYRVWQEMIGRCHKPTNQQFSNYGARGISVCERWRSSFETFRDDMGPRPSPQHSLDRIDNDGNYEPGNVRWATLREQAENRRITVRLPTSQGALTLRELAERAGLTLRCVRSRYETGWTGDQILAVPTLPYGKRNHFTRPSL